MKNHNSASKENRQIQRAAQHDASVGENATAIAPPAYGIEFVDRGLATDAHLTIQRKLTISTPGDYFEPEADRAADQVMRMPGDTRDSGTEILAPSNHSLQRKCACGGTPGPTGECEECSKKKRLGLQTKLKVNEPGDIYEHEADRIADQVLAAPAHTGIRGAPPRIQRLSGQSNGQMDAVPASVDQALASPGKPLEPALRQDMEQRFGYDFSQVRVHSGEAAEQSARDVNAQAYTLGHNMVFGAGRFAPETRQGRRLIAHELTHVVQQSGSDGVSACRSSGKRGLSSDYFMARKPRAGATGAAPPAVKAMGREEALALLLAYVTRGGGLDDSMAAMIAIQETLDMPFTVENARLRLRLLTAAFSLLDDSSAATVLKALTTPVGTGQKQLSERFVRLDRHFRTPLLDILRERARATPVPEVEQAKWIELDEGVFAFLPSAGMTVDNVAAYVSNNPYMPDALAQLNGVARKTPLPEARPLIVPMEFVDRAEAIQQIPEPLRRRIAYSMRGVPLGPEQYKRIAQVKSVHRGGPGMVGLIPVTGALVGAMKEPVKYAAGFIFGLLEGAWNAIVDLFKGALEMIKAVGLVLLRVITRHFREIWEMLKGWGEKLKLLWEKRGEIASDFMDKWEAKDGWDRGRFRGGVLGWVMMTVLITIVTWGEGAITQISGRWRNVVEVLNLAQKAGDLGTYVGAATRSLGKVGQAAIDWLRASRFAKVVEVAEGVVRPVVRTIEWTREGVANALKLPLKMAKELTDPLARRLQVLAPYVDRIANLKGWVKHWLFGCRSPCDWNPDVVLEELKHTDPQIEGRAAEALATQGERPSGGEQPTGKLEPDPSIREGAAPEETKALAPHERAISGSTAKPGDTDWLAKEIEFSRARARTAKNKAAHQRGRATKLDKANDAEGAKAAREAAAQLDIEAKQATRDAEVGKALLDAPTRPAEEAKARAFVQKLEQEIKDKKARINEIYRANGNVRPETSLPESKELKEIEKDLAAKAKQLQGAIGAAKGLTPAVRDFLRTRTPFKGDGGAARRRAFIESLPEHSKGRNNTYVDYVTGKWHPEKELHPDHIVSVYEIFEMEGFGSLSHAEQLEILDLPANIRFLEAGLNLRKLNESLTKWLSKSSEDAIKNLSMAQRKALSEVEAGARKALEEKIAEMLDLRK